MWYYLLMRWLFLFSDSKNIVDGIKLERCVLSKHKRIYVSVDKKKVERHKFEILLKNEPPEAGS